MTQAPTPTEQIETRCCIAGGGPAGMMLGFLLARAGIEVLVLEKHLDFFRDFRGDTIHPSTLELMAELGLLDEFLRLPHQELHTAKFSVNGTTVTAADFSHLPTRCQFIAFMPQWDFLNFIAAQAQRYPTFHLRLGAEVTELLRAGEQVVGVRATTAQHDLEIRASLVVGADGRSSVVRAQAGLAVQDFGVPIDILWTRLPKALGAGEQTLGYIGPGKFMVLINRGDYFQCGFVIRKGSLDAFKQRGINAFHADIVGLAPFMRDYVSALTSWDDVKLLTVKIDRLRQWYRAGLLCIGDAAHAMSPAGGVGINLAIQDAVAAANYLAGPLTLGRVQTADLAHVQRRRELPTRVLQSGQSFVHNRVFAPDSAASETQTLATVAGLVQRVPWFSQLAARVIGLGIRMEHVQTPRGATPTSLTFRLG